MKYTEVTHEVPYLMDEAQSRRPDGLHVKEVIDAMAAAHGITNYGDSNPDWLKEAGELGLMWEGHMIHRMGLLHVEPIQLDGLWCSPDAVDDMGKIHEFKVKWMSVNKHPLDSEKWWPEMAQIKAYCHVSGIKVAELHVMFVNGDYKFKNTETGFPAIRHYQLEFTDVELLENWDSITRFANTMEVSHDKE